jgi:MFS family permease
MIRLWHWLDRNILSLGREMRWSYLPPLMVYMAAGISGLTGIVGTFFVKDYLGLSAAFLAALGFWAGVPWALKMPLGHLVDLIWRWKSLMVFFGAGMIAASLGIMVGLLTDRDAMTAILAPGAWYVASVLLAAVGYVVQDVVADAMTVEAVPRVDELGNPVDPAQRKLMNTTMQTLGRVAIIGGTVLVALINIYVFSGTHALSEEQKVDIYRRIYQMSMVIPLISVAGVLIAMVLKRRDTQRLQAQGRSAAEIETLLSGRTEATSPNWWILGGSLMFVAFTLGMGFSNVPYNQEIIFVGSFSIIAFLLVRLTRELDADVRSTLLGTVIVIFVFRAMPGPGEGVTWWFIDELKFDQQFISVLSLIGSVLTLFGMFLFRRFMADHSIAYVVGFLTLLGGLLSLPYVGMYYGLHQWTAALTGGVVDARFIALVNTALESPLGQIAMIPMLAWIANSAPGHLKATYFAVMASFTNLALSASSLGTKYLNEIYIVSREVKDKTGTITVPADYSQLGELLVVQLIIGIGVPFAAIGLIRVLRLRSA